MSVAPITPPQKSYFKYIANQLSVAGYSYPSATHKREKNAGLLGVSRGRKKKTLKLKNLEANGTIYDDNEITAS